MQTIKDLHLASKASLELLHITVGDSPTQCLKITEKVAFNIASEASYVYIFTAQKFIKSAKNGQFWRVFEMILF